MIITENLLRNIIRESLIMMINEGQFDGWTPLYTYDKEKEVLNMASKKVFMDALLIDTEFLDGNKYYFRIKQQIKKICRNNGFRAAREFYINNYINKSLTYHLVNAIKERLGI